jgi:hypothetical protein
VGFARWAMTTLENTSDRHIVKVIKRVILINFFFLFYGLFVNRSAGREGLIPGIFRQCVSTTAARRHSAVLQLVR